MNLQQIFTTITTALIKQGKPSTTEDGSCKYRGPDGLKCAIGHLIPDNLYTPTIEGLSFRHKHVLSVLPLPIPTDSPLYSVLELLQLTHDSEDVSQWPHRFSEIAKEYGLSI